MALGRLSRPTFWEAGDQEKIFEATITFLFWFVIINFNRGRFHRATVETHFLKVSVTEKFWGRSHTCWPFVIINFNRGRVARGDCRARGGVTEKFLRDDTSFFVIAIGRVHGDCRDHFERRGHGKNYEGRSLLWFFVIINFNRGRVARGDCRETHFWEASVTEKNFWGTITYLFDFSWLSTSIEARWHGATVERPTFWEARRHGEKFFEGTITYLFDFFVIINFNRGEWRRGDCQRPTFERRGVTEKNFEGTITYLFDFSWLSTSIEAKWHGATVERPTLRDERHGRNVFEGRSHTY